MDSSLRPLKVNVIGMDADAIDSLRRLIQAACNGGVVLVSEESAQATLIDYDAKQVRRDIDLCRSHYPQRPLLLLSSYDPGEPDAIYVSKPLQSADFLDAINEARLAVELELSDNLMIQHQHIDPNAIENSSPLRQGHSETSMVLDEICFEAFIGSNEKLTLADLERGDRRIYFDPKGYLLPYVISAVNKARETNQVIRINTGWSPLYIFPQHRKIWVDAEEDILRDYCITPLSNAHQKNNPSLISISYISRLSGKTFSLADEGFCEPFVYSIDAFLWMLALWTSAGRVASNVDISKPVYLKSWPNLTRLIVTPHAMRIASLLIKKPLLLSEVAYSLAIDVQHLLAFITAAQAIGIVGQVKNSDIGSSTLSEASGIIDKPGLLKRMKKRVSAAIIPKKGN